MWIKHNNAIYNSNDISSITQKGTKIVAKFKDGSEEIIGEFRLVKEAEEILRSITKSLLFEDKENPGMIIVDTRLKKK
jgi:hypothetical protein